ncbi:PhyR family response regulator anti-anti-sigma factor [Hyphomonas sp.]|uniref:PhyR family response regulator anti-anti-sigma factor n=1 Tax=Hyphomonas sp. TaxID=87 RepID=UPI003527C20E
MLADLISGELPYLRRYARALLGTRSAGDAAVETMLETKMLIMLGQGKTVAQRKDLFRALDETITEELSKGKLNQEVAKILRTMTNDERRAVMLTAVEGFSVFETAEILGTSTSFVEEALTNAETSLQSALATTVLVIEDEILIAEMLAGIVLEAGHSVLGIATTHKQAVDLAASGKFGLILADIALADGSSGAEAVAEIQASLPRPVPVIFITAFPKRLLTGESSEPTFLIPKPFLPRQVRAMVEQAVMAAYLEEPH